MKIKVFFGNVFTLIFLAGTLGAFLDPQVRPTDLKEEIQKTFDKISSQPIDWVYSGRSEYLISGIYAEELAWALIKENLATRKEFYFLDVGSGDFSWGRALAEHINKQEGLPKDITVHIISVTAEPYGGPKLKQNGVCKLYEVDVFKVEDLRTLLDIFYKKWGFSLHNSLDLIVSTYCFVHLHDPIGTLVEAYNLLRPKTGMMLVSDVYPLFEDEGLSRNLNPEPVIELLRDINAPLLVESYRDHFRSLPFLLQRPDEKPLQLNWDYSGLRSYKFNQSEFRLIATLAPRKRSELPPFSEEFNKERLNYFFGDKALYSFLDKHCPKFHKDHPTFAPLFAEEQGIEDEAKS